MAERIWAGQNRYNGSDIHHATRFWTNLGIKHIMVKQAKDMRLIRNDGVASASNFKSLERFKNEFGVQYHLHPYDLRFNKQGTKSFEESKPKKQSLIDPYQLINLDDRVERHSLYPLITIHSPRMVWPDDEPYLDEEKAFLEFQRFFETLNGLLNWRCFFSRLALETMHDPFRNPGHALLGYRAEHFKILSQFGSFGLCIDTGHSKMAEEGLEKILELDLPIYSVHLHGNDGTSDQHLLPTKENVGDFGAVLEVIRRCEGPIVFEIRDGNAPRAIKRCIEFWQEQV